MSDPFDYFVVLAEMRTGSNFLESNLNTYPRISCLGEAFNPHFAGYPNTDDVLGIDQKAREADPMRLISAVKSNAGITGFRFFHDHEPRVVDEMLNDPRCGKIILTRNPVESYVSWKIASATGQWKLTNVTHHKAAKIRFDPKDFDEYLGRLKAFQLRVHNALQTAGQTAFYIGYDDIRDVDVMNGLARFLGEAHEIDALNKNLKKQNPGALRDKVSNPAEMEAALASVDHFDLGNTPNFEPRRGPNVMSYVTAATAPLVFLPLKSGPEDRVYQWMADLDGVEVGALGTGHSQKTQRQWKRKHPGHRSFTVVRHPVLRAHVAFCRHVLMPGNDNYPQIRKTLQRIHGLELPEGAPGPDYDMAAHRAAFLGFLEFLKANLSGQTAVRTDAAWASQSTLLQGISGFAAPDLILREETLAMDFAYLAQSVGYENVGLVDRAPGIPYDLSEIYDDSIEQAARAAYQKDYMSFGFAAWG